MKLYVKTENNQNHSDLHISDEFDTIINIILYSDIQNAWPVMSSYNIFCTDDFDSQSDQDAFYMDLSDAGLVALDTKDIHKIKNLILIERIGKLQYDLLSTKQRLALDNALSEKRIIDISDVTKIIGMLKKCPYINYGEHHVKTNKFLLGNGRKLQLSDALTVIHSLRPSDYVASTRSINKNFLRDSLILFAPQVVLPNADGDNPTPMEVYVKLDIDDSTKTAVALVSMHIAEPCLPSI